MSASQKIIEAMDIITNAAITKASFDKTIQAQILSCEDADKGKYRCRYQDATFIAYTSSENSDEVYENGTNVYILIPRNDMSNQKTILGTTKALGDNYQKSGTTQDTYKEIGENCITSKQTYTLDSNIKNYNWDIINQRSYFTIDNQILKKYIILEGVEALKVSASIKNAIPPERRAQGNYGIAIGMKFLDNNKHEEIVKLYQMDISTMTGDPYHYPYFTEQHEYYPIDDGLNFQEIVSVQLFCKDFYGAAADEPTSGLLSSGDIWIKDLSIQCASRLSQDQINGITIQFDAPQGTIFKQDAAADSYKTLTAKIKVKNKPAGSNAKFDFYWGLENILINEKSSSYNQILGVGWACLNGYNVVKKATDDKAAVVEWVPGEATYKVYLKDVPARSNKIKVALQYKGKVYSAEIEIQNLTASSTTLEIVSDAGTKFYYDIGHPNLTCKVNGSTSDGGYIFSWYYVTSTGAVTYLPATTTDNHIYNQAVIDLRQLQNQIANGTKFANAQAANIANYKAIIASYDNIQRVSTNSIYNFQIKNITEYGYVKCSVKTTTNRYIGTAVIRLENLLRADGAYSLVINNGAAAYQYNENGVSPTNSKLENKQQIKPLSFSIYDNLGNQISDETLSKQKNCQAYWYFPNSNTLLTTSESTTSHDDDYDIFNQLTFNYNIADKYDVKKQRNQIKLVVEYKGMRLVADTTFTFVKQGQPGTNGTEYILKLVPNTNADNPPLYPMITKVRQQNGSFKYYLNYTKQQSGGQSLDQQIDITQSYKFIKAQLWKSGVLVWEGASSTSQSKDGQTQPTSTNWEIIKNKYTSTLSDNSDFEVTSAGNGLIQYHGINDDVETEQAKVSIIKCTITYQGKKYYGTIPFTVAYGGTFLYQNDGQHKIYREYRVSLKDYTGFRYAIYSSDGMTPQYDNAKPFEFICQEKINNVWQDVSLDNNAHVITYQVSALGQVYKYNNTSKQYQLVNTNLLEILTSNYYRNGCQKNQWWCRPASRYDGLGVNTSICCIFKNDKNVIIGKIVVPIHYLLNKYGFSHLNEWDGNSIKVDNNGGGYILSPQMGAGKKEDNNGFTGVLMGEVKQASKNNSNTGLFGFSDGVRSFFLNSQNGSAIFGKSDGGQIIIDPASNKALLYSSSYWRNYNADTGLPSNYNDGNKAGDGMLIDLSTPEIRFGNGNFRVSQNGFIYAKSGGQLNGWIISEQYFQSEDKTHSILYTNTTTKSAGRITLDAGSINNDGTIDGSTAKIYSHNKVALDDNGTGFFISKDGISIGSKFKVTSDINTGTVKIGTGAVSGSSSYHWTIDGSSTASYIAYNSTSFSDNNPNQVYIGTDGIKLGTGFSVTNGGSLIASSGQIGGCTINNSTITASNSGNSWTLSNGGTASFNNITATGGQIGGWTINSNNLSSTGISLNSNGSITTTGLTNPWSITSTGVATFSDIQANGGTIGGWELDEDIQGKYLKGSETESTDIYSTVLYANGHIDLIGNNYRPHGTFNFIAQGRVNLSGTGDWVYDPAIQSISHYVSLKDYIKGIINGTIT